MRRAVFSSLWPLLLLPFAAAAQDLPPLISPDVPGCNFITGELSFACIPNYIGYLLQVIFGLTGGVALTRILIAGYKITMSGFTGGDSSEGKGEITGALIGLAVSVFAFLIVDTIIYAVAR